ncbi:MAG: glycoside hydrolase [Verrucomicrobia bacterium]|nr:MAG: glycoside hydrolase [Verrucomicrobiota bacterium]
MTATEFHVLTPDAFAHYIESFNSMEDENVTNAISNSNSWSWLQRNIPLFDCPDREVEEIYYFRWWSFRKHLRWTTNGFVFSEFLVPMKHAGAQNTISCALGHHVAEGRWLRDERYLDDYIRFWFRGNGGKPQPHFHRFSSWVAAAVFDRYLVNANRDFVTDLLDHLVADYRVWEQERKLPDGLFWQRDVEDGMEESISGSRTKKQARPTINSYMFGNARAIAAIARLAGRNELAGEYDRKAAELKRLTQSVLWDASAKFFKVLREDGRLAEVREEIGFIPWCFNLPDAAAGGTLAAAAGYEAAWAQLMDPAGFRAPCGITTAERRHPAFRSHGCCGCEWDGAVWPFATSQTLTGLANVLRDSTQSFVTSKDYFDAFLTYVRCHRFDGKPYIGEYLDETTGQWLKGRQERSRYYNHSTFADLLLTGVVGLRPRADDTVEVHPLLPKGTWDWFCLDGVKYHGRVLTILWDKAGKRYGRDAGLSVLAGDKVIARSDELEPVAGRLP